MTWQQQAVLVAVLLACLLVAAWRVLKPRRAVRRRPPVPQLPAEVEADLLLDPEVWIAQARQKVLDEQPRRACGYTNADGITCELLDGPQMPHRVHVAIVAGVAHRWTAE